MNLLRNVCKAKIEFYATLCECVSAAFQLGLIDGEKADRMNRHNFVEACKAALVIRDLDTRAFVRELSKP